MCVGLLSCTIAGDCTARWARQFPAARQGPLGKHAERSPRNLCSAGYTTFTALLHDEFLPPTAEVNKRSLPYNI